MLILFAAMLVSLIGMLGLATDIGFAMVGRRTMQNAADAGALAGTRIVAKSRPATPLSAFADVEAVVRSNQTGDAEPTITECVYLDDDDVVLGSCSALVPEGATGVRVTVQETHDTFFIHVVPGAPDQITTSATATAHVFKVASLPADGPFLVCGNDTKLATGGSMDIVVRSGGQWVPNQTAADKTFKIHGPNISKCNAQSSRYKGIADQDLNQSRTVPSWFGYTEGTDAGPVREDVQGIQGCKAGQEVNNCVAFLPIAVGDPPEADNSKQLYTVAIAPFFITQSGANTHEGRLLLDYIVFDGEGETGWQPGELGPVLIRLTE